MEKLQTKKRRSQGNELSLPKCGLRNRSKINKTSCTVCPVCTISMRGEEEFKSHYKHEVEKLKESFPSLDSKRKMYKMKLRSHDDDDDDDDELGQETDETETMISLEERQIAMKEIKKRKYQRYADMYFTSMDKKESLHQNDNMATVGSSHNIDNNEDSSYELFSCAICNEFLDSSDHSAKNHLSKCFAKRQLEYDLYSSSDSEGEETVEEFSWAGQTWIRASSLQDTEFLRREGRLMRMEMEDGDEELDVDGENSDSFGQQQFSEADVIPCTSDDASKKSHQLLRNAVSSGRLNVKSGSSSLSGYWSGSQPDEDTSIKALEKTADGDKDKLIQLLKSKLINLEDRLDRDVVKCPICMVSYASPLVSTNCWHVCCSECWMRALGTKKLCPKCSNIVAPSQLRKIYL